MLLTYANGMVYIETQNKVAVQVLLRPIIAHVRAFAGSYEIMLSSKGRTEHWGKHSVDSSIIRFLHLSISL